jgi:hypothetical protein
VSRLLVELAVATGIPVQSWAQALEEEPRLVATAVDVLDRQNRKRKG